MDEPAPNAWFADELFNLLVDYYTEVPCRPYGSGATLDNVLPVLRELQPGFVIIYAKGHSGYTTFPSALRTQHTRLGQDLPSAFRYHALQTGTRLFGYYSGLLDGIAGLRHPDWVQRQRDGQPARYFSDFEPLFTAYAICPLSDYFEQWVSVHLDELLSRYHLDGIWVDGDWAGPCFCSRCEARFRDQCGYRGAWPPPADLADPDGLAWARCWAQITHEWRTRFAARIKEQAPNCLYSAGNVSPREEYSAPFDWRSGDWFSPNNHRLQQSLICRRYTTGRLPYDAMTVDTSFVHAWKGMRSRPKSTARMLQEGAGVLANGGVWCYWTYPMPDGAFIPSKMRRAAAGAAFARERHAVFHRTTAVPSTAVLDTTPFGLPPAPVWGAGKLLLELHRDPHLLDEQQLPDAGEYELLVVPEQTSLPDSAADTLRERAAAGATVVSCGEALLSEAMQDLHGLSLLRRGAIAEGHVLLSNGESAAVYQPWHHFEPVTAREVQPLYRSWDDLNPEARHIPANWPMHALLDEAAPEPAQMPALLVRQLGRGCLVAVPTALCGDYWTYGYPELKAWVRELLEQFAPPPLVHTDAPCFVELSLRAKDGDLLIHLVNGCPGRDLAQAGTRDLWVDDVPRLGAIGLRVRCAQRPAAVTVEPGGATVPWLWQSGEATIELPHLDIHACVRLSGWQRPSVNSR